MLEFVDPSLPDGDLNRAAKVFVAAMSFAGGRFRVRQQCPTFSGSLAASP
jgi:hypothetical protein